MTVKEVVIAAANLVGGAESVQAYLDGQNNAGETETNALVRAFNMVESELALDFIPLLVEEKQKVVGGKVAYASLTKKLARIVEARDLDGRKLAFETFPTALRVKAKEVIVQYAYLPEEKGLEDGVEYESRVSKALLAYGVAESYCGSRGLYAEARFWEKKYKAQLTEACGKNRGGRIRARVWV